MKGSLSHFYVIIFTSFHDMQPKLNETRHKQGTMARLPDLIKQRKGGSGVVLFRKNMKLSSNDMILRIFFCMAAAKKTKKLTIHTLLQFEPEPVNRSLIQIQFIAV